MAKKKTSQDTTPQPTTRRRATTSTATTSTQTGTVPANDSAPVTPSVAAGGNGRRSEPTQAEIAEAAYFRHLKRGGREGDEFNDWIEAERELKDRGAR